MAKKITGYIKLQVPAGKANPSPPIGPALGQRGLNIMEFCKEFNAATQGMEPGQPVPVVITVLRRPDVRVRHQDAAGVLLPEEGRRREGQLDHRASGVAGKVTLAQCREIAEAKMKDLNANDVDGAVQMIAGSARSMGLEVEE